MDILLLVAVILLLLALAGFAGVWAALRNLAWLLLVIALAVIVLALLL